MPTTSWVILILLVFLSIKNFEYINAQWRNGHKPIYEQMLKIKKVPFGQQNQSQYAEVFKLWQARKLDIPSSSTQPIWYYQMLEELRIR